MKKFGVDIITDEASYHRWLKRNRLFQIGNQFKDPPEYPCIATVETDSYGDFPSVEFETARHVRRKVGNLNQLLGFLDDLKCKKHRQLWAQRQRESEATNIPSA